MKQNQPDSYYIGCNDFSEGKRYSDNPYNDKFSDEFHQWCEGFKNAEVEAEQQNERLNFNVAPAIDSSNQQFESLAASQQPAWDGEGLPPVGVTCEHCPGGTTQNEWEVVTVLGISERPDGVFTDYWLRKEDGSTYIIGNPYRFRPIRTEADRKREEAINEIASLIGRGTFCEDAAGIYDAIAAGKIPGIKLDSDHE